MAVIRSNQYVKVPNQNKALGMQRTEVRQPVPQGQDREPIHRIVEALCCRHHLRTAAIVQLPRATGMHLREAILADLRRLSREAESLAKISIQDGIKGGRAGASAPRRITVDEHVQSALGFAQRVSCGCGRDLIAPHESYQNDLQEIIRPARDLLHAHDPKGFHERRAAYACERYEQITQHRAPINGGECCQLNQRLDREARVQIGYELGTIGSMWSLPSSGGGRK